MKNDRREMTPIEEEHISAEHLILASKLWNYHRIDDPFPEADVIIGLGSYDLKTASYCAELLKRNVAPLLVFTGSKGNWTDGKWDKSEAEVFRDHAIEHGANPDQILVEPNSTNIGENISFTKRALNDCKVGKTIIVTKPNTLRRAMATAQKQWPNINHSVGCVDTSMMDQITEDHNLEDLINEMVGDIQRIIDYPKKGYQVEQHIPDEVRRAYHELISSGYDKHIMKKS